MTDMEKLLVSILSKLDAKLDSSFLSLRIYLSDAEEIESLKIQLDEATHQLDRLRTEYNRLEYLYQCEYVLMTRFLDWCKMEGIKVPTDLLQKKQLWEETKT